MLFRDIAFSGTELTHDFNGPFLSSFNVNYGTLLDQGINGSPNKLSD
jgi:hypothetical protein